MEEFILREVPVTINLKPRIFKGKADVALQDCLDATFKPLYMPAIVDALVQVPAKDIPHLEQGWHRSGISLFSYDSLSLAVTGVTKRKKKAVVYAHVPHLLTEPNKASQFLQSKGSLYHFMSYSGAKLPNNEFERLLGLEDGVNVFVVDYEVINSQFKRGHPTDIVLSEYDIGNIIEHPSTIPCLGGEGRTRAFIKWYGENIGSKILIEPIFHFTPQDTFFPEDGTPVARFLHIGAYAKYNPAWWDVPNQPVQINYLGFGTEFAFDAEKHFIGIPDLSRIHFDSTLGSG